MYRKLDKVVIDTLNYSNEMQSCGLSKEQADEQARVLNDTIVEVMGKFVTEKGLESIIAEEIKFVKDDVRKMESKMDKLEFKVHIWWMDFTLMCFIAVNALIFGFFIGQIILG